MTARRPLEKLNDQRLIRCRRRAHYGNVRHGVFIAKSTVGDRGMAISLRAERLGGSAIQRDLMRGPAYGTPKVPGPSRSTLGARHRSHLHQRAAPALLAKLTVSKCRAYPWQAPWQLRSVWVALVGSGQRAALTVAPILEHLIQHRTRGPPDLWHSAPLRHSCRACARPFPRQHA